MKKSDFIEGGIQRIQGILVSKNAPCWCKFRFISGAKSKDQTRFFMTCIHIERCGKKSLLISTDGHRLHIATLDTLDIEPGDYQVKENTRDFMVLYPCDEEFEYPNWRNIIDSLDLKKRFKLNLENKNKQTFSNSLYGLYKTTGAPINMEYLEPLAFANNVWDVYFHDKERAHVFINGDLMAIIMPMINKEEIKVEEITRGPDFKDITPKANVIEFKTKKTA